MRYLCASVGGFPIPCSWDMHTDTSCRYVNQYRHGMPGIGCPRTNRFYSVDPNPLLVMAESSTIQSLSINGSMYKVTAPVSRAVAIDVLASEGRLCWSDVRSKTISTSYINGSDSKTIVRKLSVPDGLAIDWIGRLVYFTDAGLNVIGVTDLEGRHTVMVVRENLDKPRAIAVDPAGGYMYWTDWGTTPKIERAFMSGRRRETLIDSEVKWPNGLTLDLIQRRLYWADAAFDRVSQ